MSKILAVANQKGGVAKTTTALAIAAVFQQKGFRVLLIDTDPQCNSTDTYQAQTEGVATLYDVFFEGDSAEDVIQKTEIGDILPCDPLLRDTEDQLNKKIGKEYLLKQVMDPVEDQYDYIIIDTPPNLGMLLINALTYANSVLIPITADRYSLQGLTQLYETIQAVQQYTNKSLKVAGMFFAIHDPQLRLSKDIADDVPVLAEQLNTVVFDTSVRKSVAARESQTVRTSLYNYAPNSTTAHDYISLVDELIAKGH